MKCDDLKSVYIDRTGDWVRSGNDTGKFFLKEEVDAVIDELKTAHHKERHEYIKMIAELKQKLEDAKATAYAESVDAGMENRRLKRALWLARAKRALEKIAWFKLWCASISTMNPEDGARQEFDKWKKNLGKFLKKAKEY